MSDESEAERSVACVCCKRSKTQGTFFVAELNTYKDWEWAWEIQGWTAAVDTFRTATEHGCRRCQFVFKVALAFGGGTIDPDCNSIEITPANHLDHEMVTMVEIVLHGKRRVALELLHPHGIQSYPSKAGSHGLTVTASNASIRAMPWNIVTRPLHFEDPASDEALQEARVWIDECLTSHSYCHDTNESPLPKRVLELSAYTMTLKEDVSPRYQHYICLSHCWGPRGPSTQLRHSTAASLKQGLPIASLPKTFSDAVKVCLKLGIKYIWIDALCEYLSTRYASQLMH